MTVKRGFFLLWICCQAFAGEAGEPFPSPRDDHAAALIPGGSLYVFAGEFCQEGIFLRSADLWEFSPERGHWQEITPKEGPPARSCHAMVADPAGQTLYIFGGWIGLGATGDFWKYDIPQGEWSPIVTQVTPKPRLGHAMVFDPVSRKIFLYGGWDGWDGENSFNDFWVFDTASGQWSEIDFEGGPGIRWGHALVIHPDRRVLFLHGGAKDKDKQLDDLWIYDLKSGTWRELKPSVAPRRRVAQTLAVDTNREKLLLFGGLSSGPKLYEDTWEYDLHTNQWSQLDAPGPSKRNEHTFLFDPVRGSGYLFGGEVGHLAYLNDLWEYTPGGTPIWKNLGPFPPGRAEHAAAYVEDEKALYVFGGNEKEGLGGDLWVARHTPCEWQEQYQKILGPAPRAGATMTTCRFTRTVFLFGGRTSTGPVSDLWELWPASNTWHEIPTKSRPPARFGSAMVYDTLHKGPMIFGGHDGKNPLGDLWRFNPAAAIWTSLSSENPPSPRWNHGMAYDPQRGRLYLFGGTGDNGKILGDFWMLEGGYWKALPLDLAPAARTSASLVCDEQSGDVYLYGGRDETRAGEDLWKYSADEGVWHHLREANTPGPRWGHTVNYSTLSGFFLLFGGKDGEGGFLRDLWEYAPDTGQWTLRTPAAVILPTVP